MVIRRGREYVERGKEGKGNRWGRLKVGKGMEKGGEGKRKSRGRVRVEKRVVGVGKK